MTRKIETQSKHAEEQVVPTVNEWRPIESAPKDGTLVLVWPGFDYFAGKIPAIASFYDDEYATKPRPYWKRIGASYASSDRAKPPTHWQLLPAAPGGAGMTSAEFIRAREALEFSRMQLSIALGASYRAVCQWEDGDRPIPTPIAKIIDLLLEATKEQPR